MKSPTTNEVPNPQVFSISCAFLHLHSSQYTVQVEEGHHGNQGRVESDVVFHAWRVGKCLSLAYTHVSSTMRNSTLHAWRIWGLHTHSEASGIFHRGELNFHGWRVQEYPSLSPTHSLKVAVSSNSEELNFHGWGVWGF